MLIDLYSRVALDATGTWFARDVSDIAVNSNCHFNIDVKIPNPQLIFLDM